MGDLTRKPSQSRFATTVVEQNAGPIRDGGVLVAPPVTRKATPVAMPAPPPTSVAPGSHDDMERVLEVERLERERATLLAQLQEAQAEVAATKAEADQLRVPVASFPPEPKVPAAAAPTPSLLEIKNAADLKQLHKAVVRSSFGKTAVTFGILLALALNGYNLARTRAPEQKVAAVQERLQQNEKLTTEELGIRIREHENNLRRMRALQCWVKQLRGASQRQGLDLPSLPPGGVTVFKMGDEDPNRPGPPRFVVVEICPDFPPLPPDLDTR